ncbi:protein Niban 2-like isoform X2 [Oncorhynchus nerka]|uniref:protein Niban 2-like isoform X2 n=1 Tax=Oncorhynchus nerka TaxID=8023 RepID=UPI0031B8773C
MGDVISSHLDEGKREIITARTGEVIGEFSRLYEQQYAVALFNKVRFDIEGGGGPQPQLLHRKVPLENRSIFSGALFQFLEENNKWRNHFIFVPDSYTINYYDNKVSHERGLHPKGNINCAGYKVLTSMDQYLDLLNNSLPGVKAKVGNSPFLKCATQFPLILWHPYARHYYFCVVTEKEQQKWHAVFQDCVRHANDGLSEESQVQTPAFTDAVRLYRQAHGQYGTWEMMCGIPSQILANLVMETLLPELRDLISPRLKGKMHDRQRNWMLVCDAVYVLVVRQAQAQYEAVVQSCEARRPPLEASIRTDMDQIITSKEHVANKIKAVVLPKAEKLLMVSIQPYISSILEALMEPTSRGFSQVRDVFFRELVDLSKNTLNDATKEKVGEHMDKISMLAFHPVKMQSCYEKVEDLSLDGLQQRFDVSSPSVFVQRAQILMREQMDDAVYTFEQILHQSLEDQGPEGLCKNIQRCQDRVIKKFDYDSSTVRKRFFREALLQIFIPYMLKQLTPSLSPELPRFQELIFEDFSRFILVENIFEEVVLHSVMKDIMMGSSSVCPRSLDCARARRHFCQPGSSHCGPCLTPLVENSHGRCIVKRRPSHTPHFGKVTTFPEVDEEIDFLSTIISQQETESGFRHSASSFQDVPKVKEEEDDRSMILTQRPTTEQPTTHGATTAPPPISITTANTTTTSHSTAVRSGPLIIPYPSNSRVFIIMTSVFLVVGSVALLLAAVCWIRLQRGVRLAQKVDYPAYGGMGPHSYDNDVLGDRRLAQSAQMYHYQHQKQQMLCLEKHRDEPKVPDSGATSDEENEDGDFTVYECPGLAPTGEMEVKNPLFDDSTLYLQRSHK